MEQQQQQQARQQKQQSGSQGATGGLQGVTQVSVLGQFPTELLDHVLRRLASHAEHKFEYELHEDVLTRGSHEAGAPLREEDVLRVRGMTISADTEWSVDVYSRPLPIRENNQVLIRSIASTPVLEGNAGAFAVALGYAERKFAYRRKGYLFTSAGGLTRTQVCQPPEAREPLDATHHMIEVVSNTASKPIQASGAPAMQTLREEAIQRTLELKKILKGLVDLRRVE